MWRRIGGNVMKVVKELVLEETNFLDDIEKAKKFLNDKMHSIFISENEIVATNGFMATVIRNDEIPMDYKNKVIIVDIQTGDILEKNVFTGEDVLYRTRIKESIGYSIKASQISNKEGISIKAKDFMSRFLYEELCNDEDELYILENTYDWNRVAFNKKYLNKALDIFKPNSDITVFYPLSQVGAITIRDNKQLALVMPVKI